jgi:hypothetical protein
MVGTIKKKVPEVAPEMDDRPASISATYQNREHDDPGLRLSYVWGKKNCGNKKSQTDLSKLSHILLAIAIFMGKVYLRGSRRNLTAEPASPTTLERSLFLSLN